MFSRPQHPHPTCHLFLAPVGLAFGDTTEDVLRTFESFGDPTVTAFPDRPHVFVSFPTAQQAAAAAAAVRADTSALGGRQVKVKFAEARMPRQQHADRPPTPAVTSVEACGVAGLLLHQDFIAIDEEEVLLAAVEGGPWESVAGRRVQHYGHRFEYATRGVSQAPSPPIPAALQPVLSRLAALPGIPDVDQLTVNDYPPGEGLSPHIDTHSAFTGAIVSLSLGSTAVMEFRLGDDHRAILLPRRSLLVMSGPARYQWQHYIPHRKHDVVDGEAVARRSHRVSFTFRQVRRTPCDCEYPEACDSQRGALPPTRKAAAAAAAAALDTAVSADGRAEAKEQAASRPHPDAPQSCAASSSTVAAEAGGFGHAANGDEVSIPEADNASEASLQALEDRSVNSVYNAIAPHFSATRFAVWPKVREFLHSLSVGAVVADVGCGNGKYFGVRRDVAVLGSDRSVGLAQVAARRLDTGHPAGAAGAADVAIADCFHLPYRRGSCDAVLCIAVLHHISSPTRRLRVLNELLTTLRPGGKALVTVWAEEQQDATKLSKWQRISAPCPTAELAHATGTASAGNHHPAKDSGLAPAVTSSVGGGDYLVPWHVPSHRPETAAISAAAAEDADGVGCGCNPALCGISAPDASRVASGVIDSQKGTVVFQRYYHLFCRGELEQLAAQLPEVSSVTTYYDRDNWCLILEKQR